ncbi:MAG: hypothetical protein VKL59_24275 [Nostocaceae cyanobacterium]|nr:hypothetical protein [Nostocaceae cyanobacterium]
MKAGLRRIAATLHDLENRSDTFNAEEHTSVPKASYSFVISSPGTEQTTPENIQPEELKLFTQPPSVQTFPAKESGFKSPSLPKLKPASISSHRHGANPALAMNLLCEIQEKVGSWQAELQQIVRQVQDIYLEGPIVDGWLESHAQEPGTGETGTVQQAKQDSLMDYVEEMSAAEGNVTYQSPRTGYRLCGMDATGKVWSRPCPPEQVAAISVAIARYQKLRQLLGRKQYLETRLSQLAETLVVIHGHIQS